MTRENESSDPGRALLEQALRDLPLRRAPESLEHRVLLALERRRALPWWRRGFAEWPAAARAGFVAVSAVLVGCTAFVNPWMRAGASALDSAVTLAAAWIHPALVAAGSAAGIAEVVAGAVPPRLSYGLLCAAGALYAALIGLGAAAYRSIYLQSSSGNHP